MTQRICLLLMFALLVTGCSGKKNQDRNNGKADFSFTSEQFYQENRDLEEAAILKKYANCSIELTGMVTRLDLSRDPKDRQLCLCLDSGGGGGYFNYVLCLPRDRQPWKRALPGQTVKLRGTCPESFRQALLVDCEIIEVAGEPPPTLTPDGLAAELARDMNATKEQYHNNHLILEGEIKELENTDPNNVEIGLKTTREQPRIALHVEEAERKRIGNLKVGRKVKALGHFDGGFNFGEPKIRLENTLILE